MSDLDQRYGACLNHLDLSPYNNMLFFEEGLTDGCRPVLATVLDFDFSAGLPGPVFELANRCLDRLLWGSDVGTTFPAVLRGMGISLESYHGSALECDVHAATTLRATQWLSYIAFEGGHFWREAHQRIMNYLHEHRNF